MLPFRNSTNFSKVNTPEINQNALITKMTVCEKMSNFTEKTRKEKNLKMNKFLLKRLQMFASENT